MENIEQHIDKLLDQYTKSKNRVLFIDYDGTLMPFNPNPEAASPTPEIKTLLSVLASDRSNQVIIISGRNKETLENWLGNLYLTLVAEHGGFYKEPNKEWEPCFERPTTWKERILPSLYALQFQYEGTFIEEKHYSLAWHYRSIADKINETDRSQILSAIRSLPAKNEFLVYDEDCTLELRSSGIDKGRFAGLYILRKEQCDFVLAIGDGKTDEDLFDAVNGNGYTIRVGSSTNSKAKYFIDKQEAVTSFFTKIIFLNGKHSIK